MRTEKDSMGEMLVPDEALYGASTQRAVLNFPVSGWRFGREFISALGLIKAAAARVNEQLGLLPQTKAAAIIGAAEETVAGALDSQFVVDIFQTGSGTSTNMNANEVIANRAAEILGGARGGKDIHPNDDVNMGQSSNDVIPTAMHVAACVAVERSLVPALQQLQTALADKAHEFAEVIKAGRTHLQDATPVTLGQEFGGYAAQIEYGIERLRRAETSMRELALGGTAVGTGVNTPPEFAPRVIAELAAMTGIGFVEARNHFEAQAAQDAVVEMSGVLKTIACSLIKIANDIRWLAAGPRCSLAELQLPEIQPGSSIMPGKVNPVICESVMMVAAQVIGADAAITVACQHGNFELNVMMPVMAHNLLEAMRLVAACSRNFAEQCITGIRANEARCRSYAEASLSNCTPLARVIGYDTTAKIAKIALAENLSVREAALRSNVMPAAELDAILDLRAMTGRNPRKGS